MSRTFFWVRLSHTPTSAFPRLIRGNTSPHTSHFNLARVQQHRFLTQQFESVPELGEQDCGYCILIVDLDDLGVDGRLLKVLGTISRNFSRRLHAHPQRRGR